VVNAPTVTGRAAFFLVTMNILISACLLGVNCRYDGGNCSVDEAINFSTGETAIPVCPEELGGLPTPRPPAEITAGSGRDVLDGHARVLAKDGQDFTEQFITGARETLRIARLFRITRALMKQDSSSCGCGRIRRGERILSGDGVTVAFLKRSGRELTPMG